MDVKTPGEDRFELDITDPLPEMDAVDYFKDHYQVNPAIGCPIMDFKLHKFLPDDSAQTDGDVWIENLSPGLPT